MRQDRDASVLTTSCLTMDANEFIMEQNWPCKPQARIRRDMEVMAVSDLVNALSLITNFQQSTLPQ